MSDRAKIPGQDEVRLAVTILDGLSLGTSLFIVAASAWIRSVPAAKHHVQRVSYNIILWVLFAQSTYSLVRLVLYSGGIEQSYFNEHPRMCVAGVFFFIKELHFTNFLITCIALNLMLIVCFGVNPIERNLLRWYVGGSFVIAAIIPLAPAILGHFGEDPLYRICYFTPLGVDQRMKVVVLDVVLWEVLSCLIASIAIITVLVTLFRQGRRTARALRHGNPMNINLNSDSTLTGKGSSTFSSWSCGGRRTEKEMESAQSSSETHHLRDQFLGIALKISLYPIFLIIVNMVISVADLYFNYYLRKGIDNRAEFAFLTIYQVLYAGRGLLFAILCICIDPSFRAGLSAAWYAKRNALNELQGRPPVDIGIPGDKLSFGQFLTSQTDRRPSIPHRESDNDRVLELSAALVSLPYAATYALPPLRHSTEEVHHQHPPSPSPRKFTRVFAGVTSESLPSGLSDDVDVDLRLSYAESASLGRSRTLQPPLVRESAAEVRELDFGELEVKQKIDEDEEASGDVVSPQPDPLLLPAALLFSQDLRPVQPVQSRLSVEGRNRLREDWFSGEDAARRFQELNAQL